MKSIVSLVLVILLVGGGLWWYADRRNEEIAVAAEAARVAAEDALQQARLEMFGDAVLVPDIEWSDAGLGIQTIKVGIGPRPIPGAYVAFNYVVRLKDGTEVDRAAKPIEARIGQMIPGVSAGLQQMRQGGRAVLFIPPKLGYGGTAFGRIPPNSGLVFEVELVRF